MIKFKCQNFDIILLYLMLNLTPRITFVKFNTKYDIALKNTFYKHAKF